MDLQPQPMFRQFSTEYLNSDGDYESVAEALEDFVHNEPRAGELAGEIWQLCAACDDAQLRQALLSSRGMVGAEALWSPRRWLLDLAGDVEVLAGIEGNASRLLDLDDVQVWLDRDGVRVRAGDRDGIAVVLDAQRARVLADHLLRLADLATWPADSTVA